MACAMLLAVTMVLTTTLATGCAQKERHTEALSEQERLDQLRSLPYAGGMPAAASAPTGITQLIADRACAGFRLYTIPLLGRADLITLDGDLVRRWEEPGDRWERAELLADGSLVVIGMAGMAASEDGLPGSLIPDSVRYVMKLDATGERLWQRPLLAHHDITATAEGELLVITFARRQIPAIDATLETRDDQLTLLGADGAVLQSRSFYDAVHANPAGFPLQKIGPSDRGERPWIDLFHTNSLELIAAQTGPTANPLLAANRIIVSVRHQDRVAVYDWAADQFVWSWGEGEISGPHDAHVLQTGNVLLFDNGLGREWSRAVEVDPASGEIVWTWQGSPRESFYTASKGSAQRLPNGNTLLAESDRGRALEVTPAGDVVWEFVCPEFVGPGKRAAIVRMTHYSNQFVRTGQAR